MARISEIDKNLSVISKIKKENLCWLSANSELFNLKGVFFDGDCYKRMPTEIAEKVSDGVNYLHRHTSGGRLLFETDSEYVAISTTGKSDHMPHMAFTGSKGFDLYLFENGKFEYYNSFVPPVDKVEGYESIVEFGSKMSRKILIHFPLYGGVSELNIGIEDDAVINNFDPYKKGSMLVYYGSSITQGGCASRPGNNYSAIVSQKTLTDFICLGFSGNAHGEDVMADYLANLPVSLFVMDYDHNDIGEPDKLAQRHSKMYKKIRDKHPDIPVIIMSAPWSKRLMDSKLISRESVYQTYKGAKQNGDNVYFIDGQEMFGEEFKNCATVDGCHPNDFGFVKMAEAVLKVIKENSLI